MGERYYTTYSHNGNAYLIRFSESSDIGCLCTFPGDCKPNEYIDSDTMAALAMVGAATVLAIWHPEELDAEDFGTEDFGDGECLTLLPYALPDWILSEIRRWKEVMEEDENELA
jgi:hypothetical protein